MVLPKRLIPPANEFYPLEVQAATPADKVLEETSQHAMAGLLSQLHWLAELVLVLLLPP